MKSKRCGTRRRRRRRRRRRIKTKRGNEVEEMGETKKKDQTFYLWLDESITCRPDIYDP